jgi:hypothetical protein
MTTIRFASDKDAADFASRLLHLHDICYKYEKDREVTFWWEYQNPMYSAARVDEEELVREVVHILFEELDTDGIDYDFPEDDDNDEAPNYDYSEMTQKMTQEDFDQCLIDAIDENNTQPSELLKVPGVYEILSEHYNNAALTIWGQKQQEK